MSLLCVYASCFVTFGQTSIALPQASVAIMGAPVPYSATMWATPKPSKFLATKDGNLVVTISGKRNLIRKSMPEINEMGDVRIGRDGSVYYVEHGGPWTLPRFLYYNGRSQRVRGPEGMEDITIDFLKDRNNYVGSCCASVDWGRWGSAHEWYEIANGQLARRGFGQVLDVAENGDLVVEQMFDQTGRASNKLDFDRRSLAYVRGQETISLGKYVFMNRNSVRSFWCWRTEDSTTRSIAQWLEGKIVKRLTVSDRYQPLLAKEDGTILLRAQRDKQGKPYGQEQWNLALILNGVVRDLAFTKPTKSPFYWVEGERLLDGGVVEIDVYHGGDERTVTFRRRHKTRDSDPIKKRRG